MITQGLVQISSAFLQSSIVEIRREAVLLLGSLTSLKKGREMTNELTYDGLGKMLFDENLQAKIATGWCINRFISGRDGVQILCDSGLVKKMVESFIKYTDNPSLEDVKFIILILESFGQVTMYDNGIVFFLKSGIINRLIDILSNPDGRYYD